MWVNAGELRDEKLVEYVQNLEPKINQLVLIPADLCNYRCKMCHIWGKTGWAIKNEQKANAQQLDINRLKGFVDEVLAVNKRVSVLLSGGEPLLYKNIVELGEYLRQKKLTTFLLTNGSLINRHIDFLINNIMGMAISIDGPEQFHDSIRQKGSFEEICNNIEMLIKEKKRRKKIFPFIQVNMTVSQYNYTSVKEYVKALRERFKDSKVMLYDSKNPWAKNRDIAINLQPLYFVDKERGMQYEADMKKYLDCDDAKGWEGILEDFPLDIDAAKLKNDLEELWSSEGIDYSDFIDINEYFTNYENNFGRSKCIGAWNEVTIRSTGDVYSCVDFPDYKVGNIYESSFKEIWEGERLNRFREHIKKKNLPTCNRCTRIWADPAAYNGMW